MIFDDMFCIAVVIGMNIGLAMGWFACKHFGSDMAKAMKWINQEEQKGK